MRRWTSTRRPEMMILAAGSLLASVAIAPSALATPSLAWPTWLAAPGPAGCAPGEQLISPTSVDGDVPGLARVHYAQAPGLTPFVPSPALTIDNVSPQAARLLGITARNRSASARILSGYKREAPTVCASQASGDGNEALAGEPASDANATHVESGNWAGYEVRSIDNGGVNFNHATGNWTVEQAGTMAAGETPNEEATWVGIGGDSGANFGLIQLGTDMLTNYGYRSWFEWIGRNGGVDSGVSMQYASSSGVKYTTTNIVRPGDSVSASVSWDTDTSACFTFNNNTRSSGNFSGCQTNLGIPHINTSAEWIAERPSYGCPTACYYNYLTNFGTTQWADGAVSVSNSQLPKTVSEWNYIAQIMASAGTPVPPCSSAGLLAYPENMVLHPGTWDVSTFDNRWCRSH